MKSHFLFFYFTTIIPLAAQVTKGSMIDTRDNQSYPTITIKKEVGMKVLYTHTWMAKNLNFKLEEGSFCYDNQQENCSKYGRLYTWEAAQKACPPGWHLPSDLEWQRLVHQFSNGGLYNGDEGNKMAFKELLESGSSGFTALLGGLRNSNGEFIYLGRDGYYWSSTERDAGYAWYYYFNGDDQRLGRHDAISLWGSRVAVWRTISYLLIFEF